METPGSPTPVQSRLTFAARARSLHASPSQLPIRLFEVPEEQISPGGTDRNMAGTATRANNMAAMVASLNDDTWVDGILAEAYTEVWSGRAGDHLTRKYTRKLMAKTLAHIGDNADRPAGFDPAVTSQFQSVDALLESSNAAGEVREQVRVYSCIMIASVRTAEQASGSQKDEWAVLLDQYPAIDHFEEDARFGKLRSRVGAICSQRGSAGAGGGGSGSGAALNVTTYTPKLEKMPKTFTTASQKYRHMLSWINEDPRNHDPQALKDALAEQTTLYDAYALFNQTRDDLTEPEWDALTKAERVLRFLRKQTRALDAPMFAAQDLEAAKACSQGTLPMTEYLNNLKNAMQAARLSGEIAGRVPPEVKDDEAWCALAMANMNSGIATLLETERAQTYMRGRQAGAVPRGYGPAGFTDWEVFTQMAQATATSSRQDNTKPAVANPAPRSDEGRGLSGRQIGRLNKERSHFVGMAASVGDVTPKGYGMVLDEFSMGPENTPVAMPCVSIEAVSSLKFPPLLVKPNGQKAPDAEQICAQTWKGFKCRRPDCKWGLHVTREEFVAMLKEGRAKNLPRDLQPPADLPSAGMAGAESPFAGSSLTSSSGSLEEARLKLLEENMSKQSDMLLQISKKLEGLETGSASADSAAVLARKRAAEAKRAMLAAQMRELQEEEESLKALQSSFSGMVSGIEEKPVEAAATDPLSEAFWSDQRCHEASLMLSKAMSAEDAFVSHEGGLPLSALYLGDNELVVMWDTGCSPSALVTAKLLDQLRARGFTCDVNYFQKPRAISGVGKDAVCVVGTTRVELKTLDGRRIEIVCGVMTNGQTGVCDIMVGNYHMVKDWDYIMDSHNFIIRNPVDSAVNGDHIKVPLDWHLVKKATAGSDTHAASYAARVAQRRPH